MKPSSKAQLRIIVAMLRADNRMQLFASDGWQYCSIGKVYMRCGKPTLRILIKNKWVRFSSRKTPVMSEYILTSAGKFEAQYGM